MLVLGFQMVFQGRKNRFVHSYLRAIGFQNNMKKSDIEKLTDKIVSSPDRIEVSEDSMGNEFVEMTKEIAPGAGIRVCGEYAEDGTFHTEYYYPYVEGDGITTQEQIEIEKHSEKESYAGVCDEMKLGVTLIFYLQNVAEYLSEHHRNPKMRPMSATLSALSLNGKSLCQSAKMKSRSRIQRKTVRTVITSLQLQERETRMPLKILHWKILILIPCCQDG